MVVTLTTPSGSKQFSMSKVSRYIIIFLLCLLCAYLAVSNWLWVKTSGSLIELSQSHQSLNWQYNSLLGTQQKYKQQLGELNDVFSKVAQQRDKLVLENTRIGILNDTISTISYERDKLKRETRHIVYLKDSLTQTKLERDELKIENLKIQKVNLSLDTNLTALDKNLDDLEKMLNLQPPANVHEDRFERLSVLKRQRLFLLNSIPNGLPLSATKINDGFGMRLHPIKKVQTMHNGIDFKAKTGTAIYAPADGVVKIAQRRRGSGKFIAIVHNFGFSTSYSHLNKYFVAPGEYVNKGQKIAESGNTGQSTGPHLHYELLYLEKAINPAEFVKWNIANFENIFTEVDVVKWDSLKNLYPVSQNALH